MILSVCVLIFVRFLVLTVKINFDDEKWRKMKEMQFRIFLHAPYEPLLKNFQINFYKIHDKNLLTSNFVFVLTLYVIRLFTTLCFSSKIAHFSRFFPSCSWRTSWKILTIMFAWKCILKGYHRHNFEVLNHAIPLTM